MNPVKCIGVPTPPVPYVADFGFALHQAKKSAIVFTWSGTTGPTLTK